MDFGILRVEDPTFPAVGSFEALFPFLGTLKSGCFFFV